MIHLIEKNVFRPVHFEELLAAVQRLGIDHEVVRYIPFAEEVEFETTRTDVWVWGAVNHAQVYAQYHWKPAVMINEAHDFNVYAPQFGLEHMLNGDAAVIALGDPLPFDAPSFFGRPVKDDKLFAGQVFRRAEWEEYVAGVRAAGLTEVLQAGVVLAPLKDIAQEVRCWIVGGKLVTASSYRMGTRPYMANYDHESYFTDFAQRMADRYQPAEAFVLDVCEAAGELKIVEVNCINAAGFYKANLEKLLTAIESHWR